MYNCRSLNKVHTEVFRVYVKNLLWKDNNLYEWYEAEY